MNTYAASMTVDQNRRVSEAFAREASRLGQFIRGRVADAGVAEDILQDVFSELLEAERLMQPIEQVGAWLYRVARNRMIDWFRRKKPESMGVAEEDAEESWEDLLPSPEAGPEALYMREAMLAELVEALGILVLSRLLFGRIGGRSGHRMGWAGGMGRRWQHMTDEERAAFRERLGGRCGARGAEVTEPKA